MNENLITALTAQYNKAVKQGLISQDDADNAMLSLAVLLDNLDDTVSVIDNAIMSDKLDTDNM